MTTTQLNPGANFEIVVDGKPRSYRDDQKIAVEAALYLKSKNPNVEVTVRDIRTGEVTPVQWTPPQISAALGKRH
jgi:electron transfer flavoprotein alpha/beta subunit